MRRLLFVEAPSKRSLGAAYCQLRVPRGAGPASSVLIGWLDIFSKEQR
jgi:hypothetical protein